MAEPLYRTHPLASRRQALAELSDQVDGLTVFAEEAVAAVNLRIDPTGPGAEELGRALGTALPTDDFETIGGYIVGLFGRLPTEGEEVEADGRTRLRVERTRGRRILAVRIYTDGDVRQTQSDGQAVAGSSDVA